MSSNSADALLDQVKTLTMDANKYSVRVDYLQRLIQADLFPPWSVGTKPYPPFIQANGKLLACIREIRCEATRSIIVAAKEEFDNQAAKLQGECEAILATVEGQLTNKDTIHLRMDDIRATVGTVISSLRERLDKKRTDLAMRQPTTADWDRLFHYFTAARRSANNRASDKDHPTGRQPPSNDLFQIDDSDRAQARREDRAEVRKALEDASRMPF